LQEAFVGAPPRKKEMKRNIRMLSYPGNSSANGPKPTSRPSP